MTRTIVGLSGKIGTGKSTVATYAQKHYGFRLRAYGDFLKEEVAEAFVIPIFMTLTQRGKATLIKDLSPLMDGRSISPDAERLLAAHPDATIGRMLQLWGTEFRRAQDPDYWTKRMAAWLAEHPTTDVFIDDVRFLNEAEQILTTQGRLYRLDPYPGWKPTKGRDHTHRSEVELDDYPRFHRRVTPANGLAKLYTTADELLRLALEA